MKTNIQKFADMILDFEKTTTIENKELLKKATHNQTLSENFRDAVITAMENEITPNFNNLNYIESEQLFYGISEFATEWFQGTFENVMSEFENFLEFMYSCDNPYKSYDDIIIALFNKRNPNDYIDSSDIFELGSEHEELRKLIIRESFIKAGDNKEITVVPHAWADSRSLVMLDISYSIIDISLGIPTKLKYTPIVIDHEANRIFFSLQGDMKMMFDPNTYNLWSKSYLEFKEENEMCEIVNETMVYTRIAEMRGLSPLRIKTLVKHVSNGVTTDFTLPEDLITKMLEMETDKFFNFILAELGFENKCDLQNYVDKIRKIIYFEIKNNLQKTNYTL